MPIKPRTQYKKCASFMKPITAPGLTSLDYCSMVRNSNLSDEELAEYLGIAERLVQRMRKLDYLPRDPELQAKILKLYLEE